MLIILILDFNAQVNKNIWRFWPDRYHLTPMHLICAALELHPVLHATERTVMQACCDLMLVLAAAGCAPAYRWSCVIKSEPCRRL